MTALLDSVWALNVCQLIIYLSCHPGKSGLATMMFVCKGKRNEVLRVITEGQLTREEGVSVGEQNVSSFEKTLEMEFEVKAKQKEIK